jgi:phosphatidylglycerophosphate synthase
MRTTPALIVCDPQIGATKIATLTLLDRLLVALHRAGCAPIAVVCRGALPTLTRAPALGIVPSVVREAPPIEEPTLVAAASLLVQAEDVQAVIESAGRLARSDGQPLPLGLTPRLGGDLGAEFASLPTVRARGAAEAVIDASSARQAESRLWQSLASSTDGLADRHFNRPLGRRLSKILIRTPITPNQITITSALIGLLGAWFFSWGTYAGSLLGALLFQFSALLDCVDGEVARIVFKESPVGRRLDIWLDQAVHIALFAAIPAGLWRAGAGTAVLWLGVSAVVGALISFGAVLRGLQHSGSDRNDRLGRLIHGATSRDFSVLLICLALLGRLEWFLWLTGIAVHLFWISALWLQLFGQQREASAGIDAA